MSVESNTVRQAEIHDAAAQSLRVQPRAICQRQVASVPLASRRNFFSETLLEASSSPHPSRTARLLFSVSLHILVLLALLLPPLYFTDTLDLKRFTQTFLVAPPPPPPSAGCCEKRRGSPASAPLRRQTHRTEGRSFEDRHSQGGTAPT